MSMISKSFSAVLPAYNEEGSIRSVIVSLSETFERIAQHWEIIVVDDGSRDDTSEIVEALGKQDERIRLIIHPQNRGYGAAIRSGLHAAKLEWIFLMDSDGQFYAEDLEEVMPRLDECDALWGIRTNRQDPLLRKINGCAWITLIRGVFGLKEFVQDVNCGFKLLKRDILDVLSLRADGAMISAELAIQILHNDFTICEQRVHHCSRRAGTPSGNSPRVVLLAFVELLKLRGSLKLSKT
jgi:glycosyltransferase involved in cell wall biosynthesis